MNIKVPFETIERYGATSIKLADGSGYVAQLGVYHELHCLKKLKRWIYSSHFYSDLSPGELLEERVHGGKLVPPETCSTLPICINFSYPFKSFASRCSYHQLTRNRALYRLAQTGCPLPLRYYVDYVSVGGSK